MPSIIGIDTTFNIGSYYVTPTTYRHGMLKNRRNDSQPTLLGPTMLHSRRSEDSFRYFGSSLVALKPEIADILYVGSDREVAVRNGFNPFFPLVTWVSCFKHVEDDIKRKLISLRVKDPDQREFLRDIFGDDKSKERGLVDVSSSVEFDGELESLQSVWEEREKTARSLKDEDEPEFFSYFKRFISEDMKRTMLKPVRESAGLGEEFYYNIAPESMNARLKQKKKSIKAAKITWPEGISLVEGLVKEQERNIVRAIIDEGPYELNKDFEHLKIDPERWLSLSEKEKLNRLSKVHGMKLTRMPSSAVTPCEDVEIPCEEGSAVNLTELATRPLPKAVGSKPRKSSSPKENSVSGYPQKKGNR